MSAIHIYQIYYNEQTRAQLDPDFIPLDNTANERPEWYEFWVIKSFLERNELDDDAFYGFFSPRFIKKTGIKGHDLKQIIAPYLAQTDVFLIASAWSQMAYFKNPFEQGDHWHPGLTELSQQVMTHLGVNVVLNDMVTTTHDFAFCNYIVARKSYWQAWKKLADAFFNLVEYDPSPLGEQLRGHTSYKVRSSLEAPMRTFIQERLPAVLLQQQMFRRSAVESVESFPIEGVLFSSGGLFERCSLQMCHHLKLMYQRDGNPEHLRSFMHIRSQIPTRAQPNHRPDAPVSPATVGKTPNLTIRRT